MRLPDAMPDYLTLRSYLAPDGSYARSDVILCFGSADAAVPRRAARLWHDDVAPWITVTGGNAHPAGGTEAEAFARTIRGLGVDATRVIVEPQARHTGENVALGLAAARAQGLGVRTVTVVAHAHAVRRCLATLASHAPSVEAHADPLVARRPGPVDDAVIADALGELARLRTYPGLGYITPQVEPPAVTDAAARLAAHLRCAPDVELPHAISDGPYP